MEYQPVYWRERGLTADIDYIQFVSEGLSGKVFDKASVTRCINNNSIYLGCKTYFTDCIHSWYKHCREDSTEMVSSISTATSW